jgi:ribosome-binding protein aMBF1 (putative translation factor)
MKTTKNRARLARERAGLSIGQAAKLLNVDRDMLARWEASDTAFFDAPWVSMSDIYGVRIEWLTGACERYDYATVKKMDGADRLTFRAYPLDTTATRG